MNCEVVNCSLDGTEKEIIEHDLGGVLLETTHMLCKKHTNIIAEYDRKYDSI